MSVSTLDPELIKAILQEIDMCSTQGVLPLDDDYLRHLSETEDILKYLIFMKDERLICGALVSKGISHTPHRMVNINLTYLGRKALRF